MVVLQFSLILMWLWEDVTTTFTYVDILTGILYVFNVYCQIAFLKSCISLYSYQQYQFIFLLLVVRVLSTLNIIRENYINVLSERGPAWSRPSQGQLVVCGFLTSCRKDFYMSPSHFESTFIKAGESEVRKGLGQKQQQERAQVGLLWLSRDVRGKT